MTDANQSDIDLIDNAVADVSTLLRRSEAETLTEEDVRNLLGRVRADLRTLRASLMGIDEPEIVLTDAGGAALMAFEAARQEAFGDAVRRIGGLTTGRALMDRGVRRGRVYGALVAIDGDRA